MKIFKLRSAELSIQNIGMMVNARGKSVMDIFRKINMIRIVSIVLIVVIAVIIRSKCKH